MFFINELTKLLGYDIVVVRNHRITLKTLKKFPQGFFKHDLEEVFSPLLLYVSEYTADYIWTKTKTKMRLQDPKKRVLTKER